MPTLQFSSIIKASRQTVWDTLWTDETYRKWTAVFSVGSYAEGECKQGGKIRFLTPDGSGMFSRIEKLIPDTEMVFKHLGELKNGVEEPKDWCEALEGYHLADAVGGGTTLTVTLEAMDEMLDYFKTTFPKALAELKQLAEQ